MAPPPPRVPVSRTSDTPMRTLSQSRSVELSRQKSSLSPRTFGKSQTGSKSSASRNVASSVRRTLLAADATPEKTPTSVSRRSASATVVGSFVAPGSVDGEGEQEGRSQEDLVHATEGRLGEGEEAEDTAEEVNYNKRLLSFFQETQPTEPGGVYGDAERTVGVNGGEHGDGTVGDGRVADGDSRHGDDPVHGQRSRGDVSARDRLSSAARRTETPNIFEAARERRNVKITPSRFVILKHT